MIDSQVMTRPRSMTNPRGISSPTASVSERLYKRWINGLWAGERIAADLVSPDFVGHWPTRDVHGPAELQAIVDETRAVLKELLFVVEVGPIIDGDIVAARWIATGATGTGPARYTGNDMLRISNGRIAEYWTGTSRA
ncbi:ester cyclase [Mycolicibacterium austroafricanum]|uniref:Nuclear transport factor 2 family protein n=2 Tax=Mycolicibacterium austroafricanum TaxID=39687 RepID=A0ABT8H9I3_MYCAO|nr:nuclear transport factor 2 family protein [Mycolicibacterium austroafricanum]MDN4517420.1 nuclear transport factor 2 family protein [Mycolicibacterium austroafricanum]QRZ07610.1 nuclear transport factor 2 family protein [Mycolicibacterium austroafricanum]QZT60433.1 ester cyclase [Mycolicibacterium austroafricanum]QZT69273.1 ester cyclase [Mycolicibacterium austroafricanum]